LPSFLRLSFSPLVKKNEGRGEEETKINLISKVFEVPLVIAF
jgi:hypothetical protein